MKEFWIVVFLSLNLVCGISITSAEVYTKGNLSIMGDQYSVGVFDLTFNDDLSIYRTYGHCASVSCYSSPCVPCDFTDPAICNGTKRPYTGDDNIDCGGCVNASNPPLICLPRSSWPFPSLPPLLNSSIKFKIPKSGILIPYHPNPPDNCSSMVLKLTSLEGGASGSLIWYAATWRGNNIYDHISRWTYNVLCPTQIYPTCSRCGWGQTVVLLFVPDEGVSSPEALLEIEWIPLPYTNPNKYPNSCDLPTGVTSETHRCIPEAVQQNIKPTVAGQSFRFVMTTKSTRDPNSLCPGLLYVSSTGPGLFYINSTDRTFLVSTTDPWVSSVNSTNALRVPNFEEGGTPVPGVWGICIPPGASIYVWVYTTTLDNFTLLVDTNREWIIEDDTSDYGRIDYYKTMMDAVTVNCGNKSFTPYTRGYSASETINTGSANIRMMFPSQSADIFYPQPIFSPRSWASLTLPVNNIQPYISRRLMLSVVLNQKLQPEVSRIGKGLSFPNNYQFLTDAEWKTCSLKFNGIIFGKNTGLPLTASVSKFRQKSLVCNATLYKTISAQIKSIQDEMGRQVQQNVVNIGIVNQLRFEKDLLATSNNFYFCEQEILGYASLSNGESKSTMTDICVAPFRTLEFNSDECCVFDPIAPYLQCQNEIRNISETERYSIKEYNETKISKCPTSLCAKDSLSKLVSEKNGLKDPNQCGESNSFQAEQKDIRTYWECSRAVFGEDPIVNPGVSCIHDNDCNAISSGSICSSHTNRCLIPIVETETMFIDCIYDNLTQFTRNYIAQTLNLNASSPNIRTLWKDIFSMNLNCSDRYSPIGYDIQAVGIARCSYCNRALGLPSFAAGGYMFSAGADISNGGQDCWNGNSGCSYTRFVQSSNQFCATPGCNTAAFLPFNLLGPTFCVGAPSFCGLCEDGFNCLDISSLVPLASCNSSANVCLLANGSKIITDKNDCQNTKSCTVPCNNCTNESDCNSSGSCSDVSDYAINIFKGYKSGCFFSLRYRPPFDETVLRCGTFRKTILGCANYAVSESDCLSSNFTYGDPNVISISNIIWRVPAKNKDECDAYGDYCADDVLPSVIGSYSSVYNLVPPSTCKNRKKLYTWTHGRWLSGQSRTPEVKSPTYASRWNSTARLGLNLNYIINVITQSVDKIKALQIQSRMFCENNRISYLDQLVCSCVEGGNQSFCFTNKDNISTVGVACDEYTNVTTSTSILKLIPTSVPPATCVSLFISEPTITAYRDASITDLRTLLVNYREDTAWAIRNSENAIVAKVLTDGWTSSFQSVIKNVTLCLILSDLRIDYRDSTGFNIIDIATRSLNQAANTLKPANLENNVTIDGKYFCITFKELESDKVYHFIQRVPNWETSPRVVFSDGEIAYLSVLLAIYFLGLVSSTLKLCYLILMTGFSEIRLMVVLFLMISFFVFRVVLFSLLLSNSLIETSSTGAVNYVLFEFPILLYFCFVTNYISIWLVTLSVSKKFTIQQQKNINYANIASVIFNLLIFLLFAIMIILLETIVAEPIYICNEKFIQFDQNQAFALIMSYRGIFSSTAIVIGIVLFITALAFGELLSDPYFNIPRLVRYRVYAISIIGGLGLVAQAIYFLVITATQITPNNYISLSILLCVETIPALLFIFVEGVKTETSLKKKIIGLSRPTELGTLGSINIETRSVN